MSSTTKKFALDIFDTLRAADRQDMGWLERQPDDARKGFAPVVAMKWMSSVRNGPLSEYHIMMVNERANNGFFELSAHPDLQYRLIASCGTGTPQRHEWVNFAKPAKKTNAVTEFLYRFWPDASDREISIILSQYTYETFQDFVLHSGSTPEEEKEVLEAYDRLVGREKVPSKKKGKAR